jgi:hypothetical protein
LGIGEEIMTLRALAAILATATGLALIPAQADAQTTQRTVRSGDRTVITSRDESGRTRTRIVVDRRSYLNPGTQVFKGEVRYNDSIQAVMRDPNEIFRNTGADTDPSRVLPRLDLPLPPQQ